MTKSLTRDCFRIACIHQGYELYGSDRCFIESVAAFRRAYPLAEIEVVLPQPGPIVAALQSSASRIVFEPLWVLRRRSMLSLVTLGVARLPRAVLRASGRFRRSDIVYINTSVVMDYLLAARLFPRRAVVHIHEIPAGAVLSILRGLVRWSSARIVFNSKATKAAFGVRAWSDAPVIYNGIKGPPVPEAATYDGHRPLRALMLGRVNRIKGQEILLEAVAMLPAALRARLCVRVVGSAFEDPAREQSLHALSGTLGVTETVSIEPFIADTAPLYRWADIVVVPSRLPESLGRVAIEAMSYGRPPLASAIGGLAEVVLDGQTGWLVEPASVAALAQALTRIIEQPEEWAGFPDAARRRYCEVFTEDAAAAAIAAAVAPA